MKNLYVLFALLLVGCATQPVEPVGETPIEGFCGISTSGICSSDGDCLTDGCSGEVCRSVSEEGIVTTCEYLDCYDDTAYGVSCGCVESQCQWT